MTREDAVTFLKDREQMHRMRAEKIKREGHTDFDKRKYEATVDLANKYACIATMVK